MNKNTQRVIVHILYSGLGGHSAVLFSLLENGFMQSCRHEVLFVGVETPPREYLTRCKEIGVIWHYISKKPGREHLKFILLLRRKIASLKPEVLFLHGLSSMPAVFLLKVWRRSGLPYVLVRETQANHLKTRREWFWLALAHCFSQRIVHLTEEASQGAKERLGCFYRADKVSIISNGLDTDFFSPSAALHSKRNVIHIGMQSRLEANKDHATLINAFFDVSKRYPDKNFHLHIAGDGTTYQEIEKKIDSYRLNDRVTMHGFLYRDQLRDFLQYLDIYVHCTHGETMSTAIMQALSCGLPVIASDVQGVFNMVTPEAGLLYTAGDSKNLADKLGDLINSDGEVEKYGRRARGYALRHYSIAETVRSYEALLLGARLQ